jgi:hypothetical protein
MFLGKYSEPNQTRPQPEPLLMYGQVVISSITGEDIGNLGVDAPVAQRYTPNANGDVVELVVPNSRGEHEIILVKLKSAVIATNIRTDLRSR